MKQEEESKDTLYIVGRIDCPRITHCKSLVDDLKANIKDLQRIQFVLCFEKDFEIYHEKLLKGDLKFLQYNQSPIIFLQSAQDGKKKIIGTLEQFQTYIVENYNYHDLRITETFVNETKLYLSNFLKSNGNRYVYIDFAIEDGQSTKLERVVLELYRNICPQTAENFYSICLGFMNDKKENVWYKGSTINRVSQYSFIQGGDLEIKGDKTVFGGEFNDENYNVLHDTPGIIGMVKKGGRNHTNECQFYITLAPLKSFDKNFVAFGSVIMGYNTIKIIGSCETDMQRPKKEIKIVDCGDFKIDLNKNQNN